MPSAARCCGLPALAAALCASLASAQPLQPTPFTVLNYNVHGLFPLIAKDDPRDRMPTIGRLAREYDVVLFQEDFEYHGELRDQLEGHTGFRGNGVGLASDPRLIGAKLFLTPFTIWFPHVSPPYGSGVSTFVRAGFADGVAHEVGIYRDCHGWLGDNGDCWASKGHLGVRVRTHGGLEIDFYNTHLEAGPSAPSVAARASQLAALADAIERFSGDRAVIASGDFNVAYIRPGDRDMMKAFRERLALRDSGAAPELPFWRERDHILYRSGGGARLTVETAGEAVGFVSEGRALSDHPALFVRFQVRPE